MAVVNPLNLYGDRRVQSGSSAALVDVIRRGGDLRIGTSFRHNEHIDTTSPSGELVDEVAEFRQTILLDDRWSAGIMTLRVPVELPTGFGPRPSMSFFMYNQNAQQSIARPFLDGKSASGAPGPSPLDDHGQMPRYHQQDGWDAETNAPSSNFVYDFDSYSFFVNDRWQEIYAHSAQGHIESGSLTDLTDAFHQGLPIKLAIRDLCADLAVGHEGCVQHEVFVHAGSCYYYTEQQLFLTGTHPVVRVRPTIPVRYTSKGWDFGWLVARTDGKIERWLCNPYTLAFERSSARHAMRWLVAP